MSNINEILLPIFLFVVYFMFASQFQFVPTEAGKDYANNEPENIPITIPIDEPRNIAEPTADEPITVEESIDLGQPQIVDPWSAFGNRQWLETQSLANLKAIAAELCITVTNDRRWKGSWINAIASAAPSNTVITLDPSFAVPVKF